MKFAPKTLTPALRAEIAEAIATLERAIKRTERNASKLLKMGRELDALDDEHAALNGRRTLTRAEATSETAIVAQRTRLQSAIRDEYALSEEHCHALCATLRTTEPLMSRLCDLAVKQVQAEVSGFLAPYFRKGQGNLPYFAGQTDLQQNLVAEMLRACRPDFTANLATTVEQAEQLQSLLKTIADDADFCSFAPAAIPAAAAAA